MRRELSGWSILKNRHPLKSSPFPTEEQAFDFINSNVDYPLKWVVGGSSPDGYQFYYAAHVRLIDFELKYPFRFDLTIGSERQKEIESEFDQIAIELSSEQLWDRWYVEPNFS